MEFTEEEFAEYRSLCERREIINGKIKDGFTWLSAGIVRVLNAQGNKIQQEIDQLEHKHIYLKLSQQTADLAKLGTRITNLEDEIKTLKDEIEKLKRAI